MHVSDLCRSVIARLLLTPIFAATSVEAAASSDPWRHSESAQFGGNYEFYENVAGKTDGPTTTVNLKLEFDLNYASASHEFDNHIEISEATTKTPAFRRYIKRSDELEYYSYYKRFFASTEWLGLFARFDLRTQLFDSYDEQKKVETYLIRRTSGDTLRVDNRLKLSRAFRPLTLLESFGAVARILEREAQNITLRTGPAAKQIYADDQLIVNDVAATGEIEVDELRDVFTLGWGLGIEYSGELEHLGLKYRSYANLLYPISHSLEDEDGRSNIRLMSSEFGVELAYSFFSWMQLSYDLSRVHDPLFVDKPQITHNFFLNIVFSNSSPS